MPKPRRSEAPGGGCGVLRKDDAVNLPSDAELSGEVLLKPECYSECQKLYETPTVKPWGFRSSGPKIFLQS